MKTWLVLFSLVGLFVGQVASAQSHAQFTTKLGSVSSDESGSQLRVLTGPPAIIEGLMIQTSGGAVRVLEVRLNRLAGDAVVVKELSKGESMADGQTLESPNLSSYGFITSVDLTLRAEDANASNAVDFSVVAMDRQIRLTSEDRSSTLATSQGCSQDVCLAQEVFVVQNQMVYQARVSGLQRDGRFELTFYGAYSGRSGNWDRQSLALATGCLNQICVGDDVYRALPGNTREARVVALQSNGAFVVNFFDGSGLAGDVPRTGLAIKTGCGRSYCVGQEFIYTGQGEQRHLRLVGIQGDGKYVMYFFDAQDLGGNWSEAEVRTLRPVRSRGGALPAPPSRGYQNGGLY